jgi:hypothetical protein
VARTAVVAGTATAVSNRVSRRQANRWAQQDAEAAYGQSAVQTYDTAPEADPMAQLRELAQLHDEGVLTDEEFAAQKAKILSA